MIALLCLVLGLAVGFVIGHVIGSAPTDPWWASEDLEIGTGPSSPRTDLRAIGGSTVGTQPTRRGCREADAHQMLPPHAARRRPPDGPSAA